MQLLEWLNESLLWSFKPAKLCTNMWFIVEDQEQQSFRDWALENNSLSIGYGLLMAEMIMYTQGAPFPAFDLENEQRLTST